MFVVLKGVSNIKSCRYKSGARCTVERAFGILKMHCGMEKRVILV